MSYYCQISFKEIEGDKVFAFLQDFKKETTKHIPDIAKDYFLYSPYAMTGGVPETATTVELFDAIDASMSWAENIFNYRWFYLEKQHILGVFSVHKSVQDMFDATIEFQNSTDQDYDKENWNGVKLFEDIYRRWACMSNEEVCVAYKEKYGIPEDDEDFSDDYWRKSFAYKEIWDIVGQFLENDSLALYLQLFGRYEKLELKKLVILCVKEYDKKIKGFERKTRYRE